MLLLLLLLLLDRFRTLRISFLPLSWRSVPLPFQVGLHPHEDRIDDPRGSIDLVDGSLEQIRRGDLGGLLQGILVVDPARVDAVHVYPVLLSQIFRRRSGQHVERRLGHIGVRMIGHLVPVEFAFHCRDVDDVPVGPGRVSGRGCHEGLETAVEHEGRDGVDEHALHHLGRRHLVHFQEPRVGSAQVELLTVHVGGSRGQDRGGHADVLREDDHLSHCGRVGHSRRFERDWGSRLRGGGQFG
mmetsp:Transcript_40438/g.121843  ORF Transcript_40438/g.121843 Transcript_40438/m.121843 type:complete len:242 (-) Transcript_40438:1207-1932(-)